jgi:hypothetical protein
MSQGFMADSLTEITGKKTYDGYEFSRAIVTCQLCYTGYP